MKELDILMQEIEIRLNQLKTDKNISESKRMHLIRENNRFLCRVQQLALPYLGKPKIMETLDEVKDKVKLEFNHFEIIIEDNEIIIEEEYAMGEDEKNDDDCCDVARENGESIIKKFPMLEISNYYCHRHKYAIVALKLCDNLT